MSGPSAETFRAKIAAANSLETADLGAALSEVLPAAEQWIGEDFVLCCDGSGWYFAYTHGNRYRDRLPRGEGLKYPEDAIAALWERVEAECRKSALSDLFAEDRP